MSRQLNVFLLVILDRDYTGWKTYKLRSHLVCEWELLQLQKWRLHIGKWVCATHEAIRSNINDEMRNLAILSIKLLDDVTKKLIRKLSRVVDLVGNDIPCK